MIAFITVLVRFVRSLRASLRDPEFQAVLFLVVITLAAGTVFYWRMEGWSVLDSLYFSVVTLTTIGYGDLSPTTAASKVFTIFYAFIGIGLIVAFVSTIAGASVSRRGAARKARKARRERDERQGERRSEQR